MKSRQGVMKCEHLGIASERTLQKVGRCPRRARKRRVPAMLPVFACHTAAAGVQGSSTRTLPARPPSPPTSCAAAAHRAPQPV